MPPEQSNETTIQYQLSRAEGAEQLLRLSLPPRTVAIMSLVPILGIFLLVFASSESRPIWPWILIVAPVVSYFLVRRKIYAIIDQHPEFKEVQTVTFDEETVTFVNSVSRVKWPWKRVLQVIQDRGFVVLRSDSMGAGGFIPKRAFSPDQLAHFMSCARKGQVGA